MFVLSIIIFYQTALSFNLIPDIKGEGTHFFYESHRYYDPKLSRFTQPDNIIPTAEVIDLNRFAYVRNNPIKYNDPSGHVPNDVIDDAVAVLKRADQALYDLTERLAHAFTPPRPDEDFIGFILSIGVGGGAGGSADDFARSSLQGVRARLRKLNESKSCNLLADAAKQDADISERVVAAQRKAELSVHKPADDASRHVTARYKNKVRQVTSAAAKRERALIVREQEAVQTYISQATKLTNQLADVIGNQLASPTPLQTVRLKGNYKPGVIMEMENAWSAQGDAFTVRRTSIEFRPNPSREARESVFFSYADADGNMLFEAHANIKYRGDDYEKLRDGLYFNPPAGD